MHDPESQPLVKDCHFDVSPVNYSDTDSELCVVLHMVAIPAFSMLDSPVLHLNGKKRKRLQMTDLKDVRSSDKTAEGWRLFHCMITKGKMSTCNSLQLSKYE